MTEPTIAQPASETTGQAGETSFMDAVDALKRYADELMSVSRFVSEHEWRVAVPLHEATLMLGMKDDGFTRNLIRQGRIRVRKEPGSKTTLVSVKSIRQYMGDIPKGGR